MRTYISTVGYNSSSVTRPVLSHGLDTDDEVVLLRPREETNDPRAEGAIGDVERLLTEIEPDVSLITQYITHNELETAVLECSDVIMAARGELIVNLGGGARDILLPFAFATIAHRSRVHGTIFFSDIDGTVSEWELPRLITTIPESMRTTLERIAETDEQVSIPDLTDAGKYSKSTVARHMNELQQEGLIETTKKGKTKYASITLNGSLHLRMDDD